MGLKSISGTKVRTQIEDLLHSLINRDKSVRLSLWFWVQVGEATAVEALLRNAAHDERVDADVFMALQRCRGTESVQQQISDYLREYIGEEEFRRLQVTAATRRLLLELREANNDERDFDLWIICNALACGADPNAREEEAFEDVDDLDEEDEAEEDDEEVETDEDDGEQQEDEDEDGEFNEEEFEEADDDTGISHTPS